MAQTSFIPHQNHKLFSDYYLDQILPKETTIWADVPTLKETFHQIESLYGKYKKDFPLLSEAQLERDFIQPVLGILGHVFEVQPTVPTPEGTKKPDYAFFESDKIKSAARRNAGEKRFFQNALAIGDAKKWDRDLDRKMEKGRDPFSNLNPSYQIDYYLRVCDRSWGVLTNGWQWRLYHRETSYSLDSYYQVNLEELLSSRNLGAFRYFYLFFRKEAFLPLVEGESFLEWVRKGSRSFTAGIEDDLKERAYETLERIMQGFLAHRPNRLKVEESKEEIKANSLFLLYRLLFILFAESNRLLPMGNPSYAQKYSLEHLADEVLGELQRKIELDDDSTEYWGNLQRLFRWIDEGHDDPPIPQYNGGLFDPKTHKFLNENKIGDNSLAEIITALTVLQKEEQSIRVVYRDLGIQHLGSVYEGLLEFRPIVKDGKIILESDKGERKVTGSYYTPDYIVRYIVENTLKPLVEQAKNHKDILNLKVLDPAMGSGHFLVGAVDFLAEQIVYHPDTELIAKGVEEKEIQYWRRRVVEQCIYGMDLNPMAVELAKLSLWIHTVAKGEALSFLDHHIRCGNSLFGAKISDLSQLPTLKKESKKAQAVRQSHIPLWEPIFTQQVKLAIGHYLVISETESHTAEDVHKKAELLRIGQEHLQLFRKAANVWLSSYFGNPVRGDEYQQVIDGLGKKNLDSVKGKTFFRKAEEIAKERKFLHWEIEFPEVFRDKHGRDKESEAGFDAVIGNPPYIFTRNQKIDEQQKKYFENHYKHQSAQLNTFGIFVERTHNLIKQAGMLGFIIPNNWLTIDSFSPLRKFILENTAEIKIVNILDRVFSAANVDTAIVIFEKNKPSNLTISEMRNSKIVFSSEMPVKSIKPPSYIIQIGLLKDVAGVKLLGKVDSVSKPLSDFSTVSTGLKAYQIGKGEPKQTKIQKKNRVFHSTHKINATYGKYLDGVDVCRYSLQWSGEYLSYGKWLAEPRKSVPFSGERILVRQIPSKPPYLLHGVFTDEPFYNDINSMVIFNPISGISLKYLLGLINSRLLSFWFNKAFDKLQRKIFPQFKVKELARFPIRPINFSNLSDKAHHIRMIELVEQILELHKQLSKTKNPNDKTRIERQIEATDQQIDRLAYELYGLTEEEIAVVEGKAT